MRNNEQTYSKSFYSKALLKQAIIDYKAIARISLIEEDLYFKCKFNQCAVDTQTVKNEFNNYLIELLNAKGEKNGI